MVFSVILCCLVLYRVHFEDGPPDIYLCHPRILIVLNTDESVPFDVYGIVYLPDVLFIGIGLWQIFLATAVKG